MGFGPPIHCSVVALVKSLDSSLVTSLKKFLRNVSRGLYSSAVAKFFIFHSCSSGGSHTYPAPFVSCLSWSVWLLGSQTLGLFGQGLSSGICFSVFYRTHSTRCRVKLKILISKYFRSRTNSVSKIKTHLRRKHDAMALRIPRKKYVFAKPSRREIKTIKLYSLVSGPEMF